MLVENIYSKFVEFSFAENTLAERRLAKRKQQVNGKFINQARHN